VEKSVSFSSTDWCQQCGVKRPAYPGARFCGAGCTARHEAHEPSSNQAKAFAKLAVMERWWEALREFLRIGGGNRATWNKMNELDGTDE
jgi:hypothetical protein